MTDRATFGRVCEDFVAQLIAIKTGLVVTNLNDERENHPVTDLRITESNGKSLYEVSVKAKKTAEWPAVKGISENTQYMVFVDIYTNDAPQFYILTNEDWQNVLKTIQPKRNAGAQIVSGALQWNWTDNGRLKKFRGSKLYQADIDVFKNNWRALPRIKEN